MSTSENTAQASEDLANGLIRYLNELLNIDYEAVFKLVENRVPCNQDLADHPTVQVLDYPDGSFVGLLGVFNGFLGVDAEGRGPLTAVYDNNGKLLKFQRTVSLPQIPKSSSC